MKQTLKRLCQSTTAQAIDLVVVSRSGRARSAIESICSFRCAGVRGGLTGLVGGSGGWNGMNSVAVRRELRDLRSSSFPARLSSRDLPPLLGVLDIDEASRFSPVTSARMHDVEVDACPAQPQPQTRTCG
ncbi:uncharacterized protein IUM83_10242 [Phytophthora cinnamomi]|uniref:uncharacterized protein n=1 Tax=Phytophthora cinnamomi TaxID=4785 RepID=UPI00355A3A04|nr:hypothetical protein IUM83_10242 [Phytophthora cinnamomi]